MNRPFARPIASSSTARFHLRRCGSSGALFRRARHQPSLCLADLRGACRLGAWLRHRRPHPHQRGARRRGRLPPHGGGAGPPGHRHHPRHRAQPHGDRRRQSLLDGRARIRRRCRIRRAVRHRFHAADCAALDRWRSGRDRGASFRWRRGPRGGDRRGQSGAARPDSVARLLGRIGALEAAAAFRAIDRGPQEADFVALARDGLRAAVADAGAAFERALANADGTRCMPRSAGRPFRGARRKRSTIAASSR